MQQRWRYKKWSTINCLTRQHVGLDSGWVSFSGVREVGGRRAGGSARGGIAFDRIEEIGSPKKRKTDLTLTGSTHLTDRVLRA